MKPNMDSYRKGWNKDVGFAGISSFVIRVPQCTAGCYFRWGLTLGVRLWGAVDALVRDDRILRSRRASIQDECSALTLNCIVNHLLSIGPRLL